MMLLRSSNRAGVITPPPPATNLFNNPFIADSAHHRPIGSGAIFADESHPFYDNWVNGLPASWGDFNPGSPYGRVVHAVHSVTSPRVTIGVNPQGEDAVMSIPASNIPYPTEGVSFNSNTPNNDSVVVFLETDTGRVHEFRECRAQSGFFAPPGTPMVARSYRPHWAVPSGPADQPITSGLGHGTVVNVNRVGHSASGTSALFGLLRADDLTRPGPIGHVLQTVLPGRPWNEQYEMALSKQIVLPATFRDTFASDPRFNLGTVPYGGLLSLPHGFNINNRGYNALQLKFAECVRDYGIMAVDHGGNFAIRTDQYIPASTFNTIRPTLRDLKPHLRLILNSAWDPNDRRKPTGGGTPRAANTGYDA